MKPVYVRVFLACLLCAIRPWPLYAQNDNDNEVRQVILETNAVQIVLNDEHRQGVDWEAIVSDFHSLQLKKEDNPIWADKNYRINVGTVSDEDYAVLLDALDTVGQMAQEPQPPVAVIPDDRQSLNIAVGDNKNAGNVRLDVVLGNSAKNGPTLHIEPYIGEILRENGKPVAATLNTRTDIPLKEHTTIVIGSIFSEQEITKTHKIPLLGDLPLLGLVFRNQGRWVQKTETMIFITPQFHAPPNKESKEDKE